MGSLRSIWKAKRSHGSRRRNVVAPLAAALFACVLFCGIKARSQGQDQIYLYTTGGGYANVTTDIMYEYGGETWVVGYDDEMPFQIVIDYVHGEVYDTEEDLIGFVVETGGGGC